MRKYTSIAVVAALLLVFGASEILAGGPFGPKGDGARSIFLYCYQWMRDDDGDGIPNGLDPDWTKPEDGTGYGKKKGDGSCSDDCDGTMDQIRTRTRTRIHEGYTYRYSRNGEKYSHRRGK